MMTMKRRTLLQSLLGLLGLAAKAVAKPNSPITFKQAAEMAYLWGDIDAMAGLNGPSKK